MTDPIRPQDEAPHAAPGTGWDAVPNVLKVDEGRGAREDVTEYREDGYVYLWAAALWTLVFMVIFLMFDPSARPKSRGQDVWAPFRAVVVYTFPAEAALLFLAGIVARLRAQRALLASALALVAVVAAQAVVARITPALFDSAAYWITVGGQLLFLGTAGWISRPRHFRRTR